MPVVVADDKTTAVVFLYVPRWREAASRTGHSGTMDGETSNGLQPCSHSPIMRARCSRLAASRPRRWTTPQLASPHHGTAIRPAWPASLQSLGYASWSGRKPLTVSKQRAARKASHHIFVTEMRLTVRLHRGEAQPMWTLILITFAVSGTSTGGVGTTTAFLDFPSEAKCRAAANALAVADQINFARGNRPNNSPSATYRILTHCVER